VRVTGTAAAAAAGWHAAAVAPLGQFCRFQAALFPEVIAPHPAGNGGNASGISTVGCTATTSGLCWLTRSASCVMFGFAIYGTTPLALQHCRSQQQAKPFPYPPQSLDFQGVLLLAGCRPLARLAADLWPGWAGWPWLPTSGPAGCRPLARPGWLALAADLWPGWLPTSGPAGLAGPGCRPLARLAADLWPGWLPTSGPAGLAGPGCRPLARPGWLALESQNPPCRPDKVDSVISDYSVCRRLGGKALAGQCGQKTVEVIYKKAEVLWL